MVHDVVDAVEYANVFTVCLFFDIGAPAGSAVNVFNGCVSDISATV